MSEYKGNTVGWWLFQLKEPLRTRAIAILNGDEAYMHCNGITMACESILEAFTEESDMWLFWKGVVTCYGGGFQRGHPSFDEGFDMAKQCAPDPVEVPAPKPWVGKWPMDLSRGMDTDGDTPRPEVNYVAAPSVHIGWDPTQYPAVVGYDPPKEVETIEGRHDREIRELQAQVKMLSDGLSFLNKQFLRGS